MKNTDIKKCLETMQRTFEQSLKRQVAKHLLTVMKELQEAQQEYFCLRDKMVSDNCIKQDDNSWKVKPEVNEQDFGKELFTYDTEELQLKTPKMEITDEAFEYCSAIELMFLEEFFTFVSPNKDTKQDS